MLTSLPKARRPGANAVVSLLAATKKEDEEAEEIRKLLTPSQEREYFKKKAEKSYKQAKEYASEGNRSMMEYCLRAAKKYEQGKEPYDK